MTQTMLCSGHPNLASPPPPISLIDLIQRTQRVSDVCRRHPRCCVRLLQDVCRLQSIVCVDRPRASSMRIMPAHRRSVDRPGLIVFRAIVCSPQISAELALIAHYRKHELLLREPPPLLPILLPLILQGGVASIQQNLQVCLCYLVSAPLSQLRYLSHLQPAPAPAPVDANDGHLLPRLSPQYLFTLFLLQAHLSGNWLYVLAFIVALVTSAMSESLDVRPPTACIRQTFAVDEMPTNSTYQMQ
ncbi:hypothetical protein R3P38DRAFT_3232811 [Favolaschia claudopus]|uniref:Uncharacterized protein n=1 Tax=Favolaschia claudopus TaxID=2862362 RepID=A0AAV9ZJ04_9AGAR